MPKHSHGICQDNHYNIFQCHHIICPDNHQDLCQDHHTIFLNNHQYLCQDHHTICQDNHHVLYKQITKIHAKIIKCAPTSMPISPSSMPRDKHKRMYKLHTISRQQDGTYSMRGMIITRETHVQETY